MTKRYFYDIAVDALYMMQHFGVKLICYYTEEEKSEYDTTEEWFEFGECDVGEPNTIEELFASLKDFRKAYVHPDSMGVYEPIDGDKDEDGNIFASYFSTPRKKAFKTAKRNKRPFIWPKEESL
jgi:hypothetical protein